MSHSLKSRNHPGFTIVELLVVIVVIGTLAAITIVSYSGISQKATVAQLQSDLKNNATLLEIDKINSSSETYPASAGSANGGKGLKYSNGTTLSYNYSSATNTYCLQTSSSGGTNYFITSANQVPVSGTCLPIGALTALSPVTIPASFGPEVMIVSPDGTSAYVENYSGDSVSMYSRNTSTGLLTALSPATISTGMSRPRGMAISADGTSVYVSNLASSVVSMYSRNTSTGLLTALSPTTIVAGVAGDNGPSSIVISPDGSSVYVANYGGSGTVYMYSRNTSTGQLAALSPATIAALGARDIKISPDGAFAYVVNCTSPSPTILMFSRNSSTGLLTALSPATIPTGIGPNSVALSPDGTSVYVANTSSTTLSMYSRNISTGLLTALSPATITSGANPGSVTVSSDNSTVYAVNYSDNTLSMFSRNTSNGLLTAMSPAIIATASGPTYVAVSPNGASVYVVNNSSYNVSMFNRQR